MKPSVSIWTTSQLAYDQRIRRIISTIESIGGTVTVWDRKTAAYPEGKIEPRWNHGPGMYLDYNRRIAGLVNQHKTDLIYAADIDVMPGLMWGLRGEDGTPLLLDLHEWYPEVIELEKKPLKRALWRWVERRSVAFATEHMTVNQSLKRIFEAQYGPSFTVVRNVPELLPSVEVSPEKRLDDKILYYQGALNEGRGLETAVESLRYLPGWRLWLVGDGEVVDQIKRKVEVEAKVKVKGEGEGGGADKEGLEDRVVFFGRKSPVELRELAGQATVGLNLLSGSSKSYYYSLANRYFDYIHAGLPAIHMSFPEYQSLMKENRVGELLTSLSPKALADAIRKMTGDNMLYNRMIEQCRSARETYNWQEESKALVEVLEGVSVIG